MTNFQVSASVGDASWSSCRQIRSGFAEVRVSFSSRVIAVAEHQLDPEKNWKHDLAKRSGHVKQF